MQFRCITANGEQDRPRVGDRVIYNRTSGTLALYRESVQMHFATDDDPRPREQVFVGRDWTPALTSACAELYARLGALDGRVARVEGSFPSLEAWEVIG